MAYVYSVPHAIYNVLTSLQFAPYIIIYICLICMQITVRCSTEDIWHRLCLNFKCCPKIIYYGDRPEPNFTCILRLHWTSSGRYWCSLRVKRFDHWGIFIIIYLTLQLLAEFHWTSEYNVVFGIFVLITISAYHKGSHTVANTISTLTASFRIISSTSHK